MTDNTPCTINLSDAKQDIYNSIVECNKRGLLHSAKWLAEINYGIDKKNIINTKNMTINNDADGISRDEIDKYYLAKTYFDCREYDRAAYFVKNCESPVPKFLYYYSVYMAREKRRLESLTDNANLNDNSIAEELHELFHYFRSQHTKNSMDGYFYYLYGVILKKLDLPALALEMFIESINRVPTLWCSWYEMTPLITDKNKLFNLKLPNHWMKMLFFGYVYIELFCNDQGLKCFEEMQSLGFKDCVFITSQMAIGHNNKRNVDKAIEIFENIQEIDPYRLDNLDIYSNLLFVKEQKTQMAHLAQKAVEINKYRPETCCIIGNYYSIRNEHQKAVLYFQRALKLNPQYLSAWTLMGHEFMELKNTNAAIQSYRKAVEVNRRDYRAWYGLGQSYEILKMPYYSLYYYKIAQKLRPYDSRMLVALGETYEKLDKNVNSIKCYQKACNVGDIEGIALLRLANLYESLGDLKNAVPAYLSFCTEERVVVDKPSLCRAYMILANHFEKSGDWDQAANFAYKCLEHDDMKNEARSLLKTIENKRTIKSVELQQQKLEKSQQLSMNNTTNIDIDNNDISMEDSDINQPSCSSTTDHLMSFDKSEDL